MKTSEQIAALADALSKAQAAMTGAKKDKANPFFRMPMLTCQRSWKLSLGRLQLMAYRSRSHLDLLTA